MTAPLHMLPDYLIIGAQRAGTSSLYSYLWAHPLVGKASTKELHFFDVRYDRGLAWYRRQFPTIFAREHARLRHGSPLVTGEASPYYLFHPAVPDRVARDLPRVKLVVLLRDPVARAYSHYNHVRRRGFEPLSFEEAIELEHERVGHDPDAAEGDGSRAHRRFSYLTRGLYAEQLERWSSRFPRDQMLVLCAEDLFENPAAVVAEVYEFLGLPPFAAGKYRRYNAAKYPDLAPGTRSLLADYYREPNQRLYEYLGRDLGWD